MSKPKPQAPRKERPRAPEAEALLAEETVFRDGLRDFALLRVDTPLDIFKKAFKFQEIKISFESGQEAKTIFVLILSEVEGLMERQEEVEPHVKNILKILNREELKKYEAAISGKLRTVKKLAETFIFVQPREELVLQKLGKILKKVVLRGSFFTAEAFGQLTSKSKQLMAKPNLFKDQEAAIERRSEVLEALKAGKGAKDKGGKEKGAKVFVWPEKKEVAAFELRVTFTDHAGRQRAIYCRSLPEAKMLKDNAVVRRTLDRDPNIKGKVLSLKTLWKVKRAEGFYKRNLQRALADRQANEKVFVFNEGFKNKLKEYLRRNLPNLYDSNYKPQDLYNFEDNSHLVFKKGGGAPREAEEDLEVIKRQLATIISPEMYVRPDSGLLSDKKKKIYLSSPFEELYRPLSFNDARFRDLVSTFRFERRVPQIGSPEKAVFVEHLVSNSKLLLQLKKVVISNVFNWKEFPFEPAEVDGLIFEAQMFVEQGNYASTSLSFISEVDPGYVVFDLQNSIKVDLNSLKHLHVRLLDKLTEKSYLDEVIDIHGLLDTVYLENQLSYEFGFRYKGFECPASLYFALAFLPRNLEIAHVTLTPRLIETNFDKFEQIVKASETFADYRRNFFPPALRTPDLRFARDFFYHLNGYYERSNFLLSRQENLFANSCRESLFAGFAGLLEEISNREPSLPEILLNNSARLAGNERLNLNPYYDLVTRVAGLLSPKERLLLNRVVFDHQFKPFVNLAPAKQDFAFHKIMVEQLNRALRDYFEQHPYVRPDQRALTQKLVFELYLFFENNTLEGRKYRIDFSPLYVPTVANLVQANAAALRDQDLRLLAVTHILGNNFMRKFSDSAHLAYLDSLIVYFKLLFKNQYSDFYSVLQQFSTDYDTFLAALLMNSFAALFGPINFALYSDFKFALLTVFIVHNQSIRLIELLERAELAFSSLIDVLFLLSVFVSNSPYIKLHATPATFVAVLEELLVKESFSLRANFAKVIELLDFVYDRELFVRDFAFLKSILRQRQDPVISNYKSIAINLKSLQADKQLVKRIIDEEVGRNAVLANRALALFSKAGAGDDERAGPSAVTQLSAGPDAPRLLIDEDVYFEILEDEELEAFNEPHEVNRSLPKYTAALVFLNNLDYLLVDSLAHNQKLVPDLNSVLELGLEDMNKFFVRYFNSSESLKMELYNDLAGLLKTKRIPLLKLLVVLASSFSEDPREVLECLEHLAAAISRLYFPDAGEALFNEAVKFVVDELYGLLPLTYFGNSMHQNVDAFEKDLCCGVKSAKISFGHDVIDVTEILTKHFASNSFVNKRPSLLCGAHLCNDLVVVFEDLANNSAGLDYSLRKFDITIEYRNKGELEYFRVPFRIGFQGGVRVICRFTKTIFFDNFASEKNLLAPATLRHFLRNSPFFYFTSLTSLRLSTNFVGVPFAFKFKHRELFLTAEVVFSYEDETRVGAGLLPWKFTTENFQKLSKFQSPVVSVELNYAYFFLPVRQIFEVLTARLVESLSPSDVFRFIKLNNHNCVISTSKNKAIEDGVFLFELTDYERAVKRLDSMFVVVNYSS